SLARQCGAPLEPRPAGPALTELSANAGAPLARRGDAPLQPLPQPMRSITPMVNLRSKLVTAAAVGAAAIGGSAIASAATSGSSSSGSSNSASSNAPQSRPQFD